MILRPAQIYQLRLGRQVTPANWGGDSDSDSSTTTENKVTNNATDNSRMVSASDAAVSIAGEGNTVDRSTSTRSSTITQMFENSNRSTNFSDSSNRSTNVNVTDYGSVGTALAGLGQMTGLAFNTTGTAVNGVIGAMGRVSDDSQKSIAAAFASASASSANSVTNSAAVLGFASATIDKTNAAFAQAKDGGKSKMVTYALAVVAVIGVAYALRTR